FALPTPNIMHSEGAIMAVTGMGTGSHIHQISARLSTAARRACSGVSPLMGNSSRRKKTMGPRMKPRVFRMDSNRSSPGVSSPSSLELAGILLVICSGFLNWPGMQKGKIIVDFDVVLQVWESEVGCNDFYLSGESYMKKHLVGLLCVGLCAMANAEIESSEVDYSVDGKPFKGVYVRDSSATGKRAGVLVVPE